VRRVHKIQDPTRNKWLESDRHKILLLRLRFESLGSRDRPHGKPDMPTLEWSSNRSVGWYQGFNKYIKGARDTGSTNLVFEQALLAAVQPECHLPSLLPRCVRHAQTHKRHEAIR
jgi:hypothetical protein